MEHEPRKGWISKGYRVFLKLVERRSSERDPWWSESNGLVVTEKSAEDSRATISVSHISHAVNLCLRFSGVRGPIASETESHTRKYCGNKFTKKYCQISDMTAVWRALIIDALDFS